jgi:hypothetical protein
MLVVLRGGPADWRSVEVDDPPPEELEVEIVRTLQFRLAESVGGSRPVVSRHLTSGIERHRYRFLQRDPPVLEWLERVQE